MGIKIERDVTIQQLQADVFNQIQQLAPKPKVEEQVVPIIQEISVEDAIRELIELEKLNALPQEHPQ
jgi:hypothetical protein